MGKHFRRCTMLLLIFCLVGELTGQVLENYNTELIPNRNNRRNVMFEVNIKTQTFPKSYLQISVPKGTTVFASGKLWYYAKTDSSLTMPLAEYVNLFQEDGSESSVLSFYRKGLQPEMLSIQKGFFDQQSQMRDIQSGDSYFLEKREISKFNDFFFAALLTTLFLLALFKSVYPFLLNLILNPASVISAEDFSDTGTIQKFFTLDVIFYLLIINMLGFLVAMWFIHFSEVERFSYLVDGDLNQLFLIWLIGSLALIGVSILKFGFLSFMGFVFDLQKIVIPHFFYLFRIISIALFGIVLIISIILLNDFVNIEKSVDYFLPTFFWVYLIGVLFLFVIMVNRVPFKNYHLFVYICSAEIVPFLILSKILIG